MKNLIFLISTIITLLFSCKDSVLDDVGPITGSDTLECKLNGETWKPQGGSFGEPKIDVYYSNIFSRLIVSGYTNTGNGLESLTINSELQDVGEFTLGTQNVPISGFKDCMQPYSMDTLEEHKVIITKFDKTNKIIAGDFFFTAINPDCADTVKVTEGKFNATYRED